MVDQTKGSWLWGLVLQKAKSLIKLSTFFRSVKNIDEASPHLSNIQDLLKNSIFLQQQIKYENARK